MEEHKTTITPDGGLSKISTWIYRESINNGTGYGAWSGYLTSSNKTQSVSITTSGQHKIQVEATDKAGLTSVVTSNVFNIDKTMPSASISYSTTGWTNGNVIVTTKCSDTGGSEIKTTPTVITAMSNTSGNVVCVDNAGNTSANTSCNVTNIDKIAPVIKVSGNQTYTISTSAYTGVMTGVTASDNIGGNIISKVTYTSNVNMRREGTYTVTYKVTDLAGNSASGSRNIFLKG
ncbi:MAG: immunoglobulin-like domain-containing protein [Bacilli bacterium]